MQLILIGFMGSGKTTIARKVAHYFKSQWVDLDRYIIEEQQMSINDIFALKGQSAFREMEFNALQQLIKQDGVIATGGGIVDNAQTRYLLQQSGIPVFYLNGTYEAHWRRVSRNDRRPLVNALGHDGLRELYYERRPKYFHMADYTIYFQHKTPNMMLAEIEKQLPRIVQKHAKRLAKKSAKKVMSS